MNDHTLRGQVAVVTGAASGMGLACALALARRNATLHLLDRDAENLESALLRTGETGSAEALTCDIAEKKQITAVLRSIEAKHGKIDLLVNCAGINRPDRHFDSMSDDAWDAIISVNLSGMYYCCQAVLGGMRRRGSGTIINLSSWAGRHAVYLTGPAYNASKRAVLALTESINIEEGLHGIRATAIVPEAVNTPLIAKRPTPPTAEECARMLQPEDIAKAVVFIASMPPRVCINEFVISPTWNADYLGLMKTAISARS